MSTAIQTLTPVAKAVPSRLTTYAATNGRCPVVVLIVAPGGGVLGGVISSWGGFCAVFRVGCGDRIQWGCGAGSSYGATG